MNQRNLRDLHLDERKLMKYVTKLRFDGCMKFDNNLHGVHLN